MRKIVLQRDHFCFHLICMYGLNSLAGKREKRKLLYRSTTEFEKYDIIAGSLEVRRLPFSQDCIFPVQNAVYKFIKY